MIKKKTIDINGEPLHEVGMRLERRSPNVISTLKYPISRIDHKFFDESLLIEVPAFLAVELYRNGTIPQKQDTPLSVKLDGIAIGSFLIEEVIYPNDTAKNSIQFKLAKLGDVEVPVTSSMNS